MESIGAGVLWGLFRHLGTWLANLSRAGRERRKASKKALRGVIAATRETAVYVRQLDRQERRDHAVERRLARLWTELAFELEDLGLGKLSKRCQITGKYWSEPGHYDGEFLEKADVRLERVERMALEILHGIGR